MYNPVSLSFKVAHTKGINNKLKRALITFTVILRKWTVNTSILFAALHVHLLGHLQDHPYRLILLNLFFRFTSTRYTTLATSCVACEISNSTFKPIVTARRRKQLTKIAQNLTFHYW